MPKVLPALEWIRIMFMKIAELIAGIIQTDANNIYNILLIVVSLWLSSKLLKLNYSTTEGRGLYLIILTGIIFWTLKFLGIN